MQKYNTPLEQATTPYLEALHAYSLGFKKMSANDTAAALPFFQRATQLDPHFAMAYWAMGLSHLSGGERAQAAENARKAFEFRSGATDREKLHIEADYNFIIKGDLADARAACELGAQSYPRDLLFHGLLQLISNAEGQYEVGLRQSLELSRLNPDNRLGYRAVAFEYLLLNRLEDAEAAVKEAHTKGLDYDLPPLLYEVDFYRNDAAEMAHDIANSGRDPEVTELLLNLEADTAAYFGHLREARDFSRQAAEFHAVSLAIRGPTPGVNDYMFAAVDPLHRARRVLGTSLGPRPYVGKETAGDYSAVSALREALFGNAASARQLAGVGKKHSTGRDTDYGVGLALAYAGDQGRAQALVNNLNKRFPEDTIVQFNYLPTLRAKLALNNSNPQGALEILRAATPYELGLPALGFYNWPNMYPVYVRGEAYLAAHRGQEAAAEFQKILDHRGIVLNEPIGALARLQLGRADVLQGDTAKARTAYQDFLNLWRDADPDIPILKQAKAEYSKLQ